MNPHPSALGESYEPFGQHLEDPYAFYAQLRASEQLPFSPVLNAYLVSRFEDIQTVLSQPELFSSLGILAPVVALHPRAIAELSKTYPFTPTLVDNDDPEHARFREPLQKVFSPPRVRALEPFIQQRIHQLIDRFLPDGHVEIISQFSYPFPLEVILTILGIPPHDLEQVKRWCQNYVSLLMSPLSEEEQVANARNVVIWHRYLIEHMQERRQHPREDLLTDLVITRLPGAQPLSDAELIYTVGTLIIAGHETTMRLIGNGLVHLLEEPERWRTLCEHPEYIPQMVEEILRYHGPVRGFRRIVTSPTTLGGTELQEGANVFLLYSSGNRDEAQFADANQFQMQRKPNHHVAFGYGIHFCIGAPLARLQGRLAFEALTQRLPGLRLVPGQHLAHNPDIVNYGYQRVELEW